MGGIQAASTMALVSTYMGFAASVLTSVGSLSSGPGTFLIVNAIQIARTTAIYNYKMDVAL